ncbi:hypothetical protein [Nocardia sp. NRRL S-836]|uniref:hypothetical protein n=1 Tax=Nocardia sp. NRRL S-836 TaxID=1519492 RepID=UPI0006AE15F6|nr:hypothetical protein [Nocardia sp. NRRL S-836]KOV87597.1 hypothetical protein ADL03_06805 [Nocardia sp. NRRL S-836]
MTGIGHDIVKLYSHVRGLIVQDAPTRSTAPAFIAELLDKVDSNPHIGQVLEVLGTYAIRGRFYNLDHLADAPQPGDSPKQLWEALHHTLLTLHPNLLMQLASVDQSQAARAELNKLIIGSITDWQGADHACVDDAGVRRAGEELGAEAGSIEVDDLRVGHIRAKG